MGGSFDMDEDFDDEFTRGIDGLWDDPDDSEEEEDEEDNSPYLPESEFGEEEDIDDEDIDDEDPVLSDPFLGLENDKAARRDVEDMNRITEEARRKAEEEAEKRKKKD